MTLGSVVVTGGAAIGSGEQTLKALGLPIAPPIRGKGTEHVDPESLLFASAGLAAAKGVSATSSEEIGVVCGTCAAGSASYHAILHSIEGGGTFKPSSGPRSSFNAPAAELSMRTGSRGPTLTVTSGDAAGLEAVLLGRNLIRDGRATLVLAGGVDVDEDAGEAREGSAALALAASESNDILLPRLDGGAVVYTPEGGAEPLRRAASAAIRQALSEAERDPREVEYVATASSPQGSAPEARDASLRALDGVVAPTVVLDDLPAAVGGAAGALASLAAVVAVAKGAGCALVTAVESDGRALALVVAGPKGASSKA